MTRCGNGLSVRSEKGSGRPAPAGLPTNFLPHLSGRSGGGRGSVCGHCGSGSVVLFRSSGGGGGNKRLRAPRVPVVLKVAWCEGKALRDAGLPEEALGRAARVCERKSDDELVENHPEAGPGGSSEASGRIQSRLDGKQRPEPAGGHNPGAFCLNPLHLPARRCILSEESEGR